MERRVLLTESVYRSKGQSAWAIAFTEIDFANITDKDCRKLFVGLTQVQMTVGIILMPKAYARFVDFLV
jgi:hypothetical protein